ncbi:MAG: hypothetical protein GXP01_08695 [Alphaproteobacteria bacterium]|nr:hypothetical protein [Alphaproteobacteria bacterium]
MNIDWNPPPVRGGLKGQWDSFVGPGATDSEEWLQLCLGALIAAICFGWFIIMGQEATPWYGFVVVAVLALDVGGGIVTNAANSAKRWYHRPGYPSKKHIHFVALHALHLGVTALLFSPEPVLYLAATIVFLILATLIIVNVPLYLQRPVAFGIVAIGLTLSQVPFLSLSGLEWLLPLMMLKLLLGHLVKEAPFRPENRQ